MTYQDRIAALRSALETVDGECDVCSSVRRLVRDALVADDLAASAPLPDLPLAEGSEWDGDEVVDYDGNRISIASEIGTLRADGVSVAFLPDVLALARRGGHV